MKAKEDRNDAEEEDEIVSRKWVRAMEGEEGRRRRDFRMRRSCWETKRKRERW